MMRSSFDSQLRQLNNELIEMGALCEEAISLSAKALAEGSAKIAGGVAPIDNEIDKMERDIETLCCRGSSSDFRSAQDDNRYGAHR